jgi:hypothetical protein
MRKAVHDYAQTHDGQNKSFGVEMGYRYESSILFRSEVDATSELPALDKDTDCQCMSQVSRIST